MAAMSLAIRPLETCGLHEALALVTAAYDDERRASPLLPPRIQGDAAGLLPSLERCLDKGCVGAFRDGKLVGFMGVHAFFPFKGHPAALVREVTHAASGEDRLTLYRLLYESLGECLRRRRVQLHIVAHFAADRELADGLFQLGFGALLAERLRDLSEVRCAARVPVAQEKDFLAVEEIDGEHMRYYRGAPMFLLKDDSPQAVRAGLLEHQDRGDALFVYRESGAPAAYLVAGPCLGASEGLVLRNTNSAQVLSAYARPEARGRGVGKALLSAAVEWARERGYERLFVEHETANLSASRFWGRHFSPYLYFSMRYVEDC